MNIPIQSRGLLLTRIAAVMLLAVTPPNCGRWQWPNSNEPQEY